MTYDKQITAPLEIDPSDVIPKARLNSHTRSMVKDAAADYSDAEMHALEVKPELRVSPGRK